MSRDLRVKAEPLFSLGKCSPENVTSHLLKHLFGNNSAKCKEFLLKCSEARSQRTSAISLVKEKFKKMGKVSRSVSEVSFVAPRAKFQTSVCSSSANLSTSKGENILATDKQAEVTVSFLKPEEMTLKKQCKDCFSIALSASAKFKNKDANLAHSRELLSDPTNQPNQPAPPNKPDQPD